MSILFDTFKKQVRTIGNAISKAIDFIPGGRLAEGIGYAISTPYINKLEQESLKRGDEITTLLDSKIQENKVSGKSNDRLLEMRSQLTKSPTVSQTILDDAPSTRQIVASSLDLALTASLGYNNALKGIGIKPMNKQQVRAFTSLAKEIEVINKAAKLKHSSELTKFISVGKDAYLKYGKEVGLGATIMGLTELHMRRDATLSDVINAAEMGGGISAVIPVGSEVLGATTRGLTRQVSKGFRFLEDNVIGKLRGIAQGDLSMLDKTVNPKDILKTVDGYNKSIKQQIAESVINFIDKGKGLKAKWIDRYSPLQPIQRRVEDMKGGLIEESEKVYRNIRMVQDLAKAMGDIAVDKFNTALKPFVDILDDVKIALLHLDYMDRAKLGNTLPRNFANSKLEGVVASYKRFTDKLSPDVRRRIGEARKVINSFVDDYLEKRVDQGILTREAVNNLKSAHPNYIPHKVILEAEEDALRFIGNSSLNVSKSDIYNAIGSIKKLKDPILALKESFYTTEALLARNNFLQELVETQRKNNVIPGMRPLETAEKFYNRFDAIRELRAISRTRDIVAKTIKSDKKEYQVFASKLNKQIKKVEELMEKAILECIEGSVPRGGKTSTSKFDNMFKRYEDNIAKYNSMLAESDITGEVIAKNKGLLQELKEQSQELLRFVTENRKLAKARGEEVISYFKDGVLERWVVPNDVAYAIKNLGIETMPGWLKMITIPQRIFKEFTTTKNISFTLRNKARDEQTAYAIAESLIDEMVKRYNLMPKSINMSSKELLDLYRREGGYGASIFKEGYDPMIPKLEETGIVKFRRKANPLNLIGEINEAVEVNTRLKVFQKALQSGLSPKDAAFVSRDATIDFAKMGSSMRNLNQVIPFLNARVQGFANIARVAKNNPEAFFRTVANTTVYPTLVLQKHNMQFESYKDISQDIKNRNWVIMVGETEAYKDGNKILVPQMFTIPKGEVQQIIASPLQWLLDSKADVDVRGVNEMLLDTISQISPVTTDRDNVLGSFFSQFGVLSIPIGLYSNKDPFYNTPLVPTGKEQASKSMQYKDTTPNYIRDLAETINNTFWNSNTKGVSPAQIEYIIKSSGGVPQDISNIIDKVYDKSNAFDAARNPLTNSVFGRMSTYPLLRGIMREDRGMSSSKMEEERAFKAEEVAKSTDIGLMKKELIEKVIKNLDEINSPENKIRYIQELGRSGQISESDFKDIQRSILYKRNVGTMKKSDPNDVKGALVARTLSGMKTPEEKIEYIQDLGRTEMISKDTLPHIIREYYGDSIMEIANRIEELETREEKIKYVQSLGRSGMIDETTLEKIVTIINWQKQFNR